MTDHKIILCFGDSLTEGYGFTNEHSYPGILKAKLEKEGFPYDVINAGVSGDTTNGGLCRISRYLDLNFDIAIIELGINDAFQGVPVKQIKSNLNEIILKLKNSNPEAHIVIAGMQGPFDLRDGYVRDFIQLYPDLAKEHHTIFIPSFLKDVMGVPALNLHDRLHPNMEGYKIIAKTVYDIIFPYLT